MGRPNDDTDSTSVVLSPGQLDDGDGLAKRVSVSFDVGIGSFPYLIDHGFQDMIVLPGSFYIELALRVHIESLKASVGSIRRIEFRNPVILPERNVTLSIGINRLNDVTIQYLFWEARGAGTDATPGLPCAILEIECEGRPANAGVPVLAAEAFRRDNPDAKVVFYDTGHFALETHAAEIGQEIHAFLAANVHPG